MRKLLTVLLVAGLIAAVPRGASAQEFEAVAIKPNKSNSGSTHISGTEGMYTASNVSLRLLIVEAFGIKDYQVEGPDWIGSERFDVNAKYPASLSKDREKRASEEQVMMQKMLADRFGLTVHHSQKTLPVYGLLVEKKGIFFKEVPGGNSQSHSQNNHYTGTSVTMSQFAEFLSRRVDLPVLDMTGLKGSYDLTLDWVPDGPPAGPGDTPAAERAPGLTLREAIQDKLGLRLESRKAPVEMLVVDHAERMPTEN